VLEDAIGHVDGELFAKMPSNERAGRSPKLAIGVPTEIVGSGGLPFTGMMKPADFGPRYDPTAARRFDRARLGGVLAEREVCSRALIIRDVSAKHASEVSLVEDDDVV
jgi:hypothetical protein